MSEKIIIVVNQDGTVEVKTQGFTGASCLKASAFIENALGPALSLKKTAEYFQEIDEKKVSLNRNE